jgi:hypothetical protein
MESAFGQEVSRRKPWQIVSRIDERVNRSCPPPDLLFIFGRGLSFGQAIDYR